MLAFLALLLARSADRLHLLTASSPGAAPPTVVLSNGILEATIGHAGLVSVADERSGTAWSVHSDAASVSGADEAAAAWSFSTANATCTGMSMGAGNRSVAVSYAFATAAATAARLVVNYTLDSGWAFVQKTLRVGGLGRGVLKSVQLFDGTALGGTALGDEGEGEGEGKFGKGGCPSWNSSFVQAGHVAAFLRCGGDGGGGGGGGGVGAPFLFASVQNPFGAYRISGGGGSDSDSDSDSSAPFSLVAGYADKSAKGLLNLTLLLEYSGDDGGDGGGDGSEAQAAAETSPPPLLLLDGAVLGAGSLLPGRWIRPHTLSGAASAARPPACLNSAERDALVGAVRPFLLAPEPLGRGGHTVKVNVGWDSNDFQIDIANGTQREEYKRLITRNAQLGITHMVFAPINSELANGDLFSNRASELQVGWEAVLWADLGVAIRNGSVAPARAAAALPASQAEIVAYAKEQGVKLMAYVPDPRSSWATYY